jgi:hypothetical protein
MMEVSACSLRGDIPIRVLAQFLMVLVFKLHLRLHYTDVFVIILHPLHAGCVHRTVCCLKNMVVI